LGFNGGRAESGDVIDVLCHRIETVLEDQARVDRTWARYGVVVLSIDRTCFCVGDPEHEHEHPERPRLASEANYERVRRLAEAVCDFVPWPGIVGLVLCYVGDV
jgi:hypothetical protein